MPDTAEKTKLDKVYRHLHGEIVRGRFQTGERLPTEEELADRFGYSRTTVAKAIRMLAQQVLVERRRRAGSFVRAGSAVRSQLLGAMICGAAERDAGPTSSSQSAARSPKNPNSPDGKGGVGCWVLGVGGSLFRLSRSRICSRGLQPL